MRQCRRFGAWLCLLFSVSTALHAQQSEPASHSSSVLKDVTNVAKGTGYVLSAPLRWRGKDWAIFGSVIAGTVLISTLDESTNRYFVRHQSATGDKLADFGKTIGEPRTGIILAGGLYVIGWIADDPWLRDTCVILTASLLPDGGIQTITKIASGRARPHVGLGHGEFDPFSRVEAYHSFFSGHTMLSVGMSHVFVKRIDNPYIKVMFYGVGAIGSWSRLYTSAHWLSDVALGGALAVFTVEAVSAWYAEQKAAEHANGKLGVQWRLMPSPRAVHLSVSW